MPSTGSEVTNLRVASSVVGQLGASGEAEGTTRKVIITRAVRKDGIRIPQPDLGNRTPRQRRGRAASRLMAQQIVDLGKLAEGQDAIRAAMGSDSA